MSTPHMSDVRAELLATLKALRDPTKPMEPDRARAAAQVAGVLVDSARVEVEFLKVTGQKTSAFIALPPAPSGYTQGEIERAPGVTRHTMKG